MITEASIRSWIYLAVAIAICAFIVAGGGSIFYLFGVSLLWFAVAIGFFLAGAATVLLYPPPIMNMLGQILETLEFLVQMLIGNGYEPEEAEEVEPQHPEAQHSDLIFVPGLTPIAIFTPAGQHYTSYLIVIRSGDRPNRYLETWNPRDAAVQYTANPDKAHPFSKLDTAKTMAYAVYVLEGRCQRVEIVGVVPEFQAA